MDITLFVSPRERAAAGSTLSVTLVARNASSLTIRDATIAVPVPYGTSYVEDSLFHDAHRGDPAAFFYEGCEIAALEPASRTAFIWRLRVKPAEEPIRIVPQIFAGVTSVVGAEAIEVSRSIEPRDLAWAYREFEGAARAYFEEIFQRPAPASLQQALFACALACALDAQNRDDGLDVQAQALHRLAKAVRGHGVTGGGPNFLVEMRGLRNARIAAATIEGLRAFAALDVAARNLAANDGIRDAVPFA
ncbi:MAG: hypothetical protein ACREMP_08850 [Candidatus Tyrphobacter sp.]